MSVWFEGTAEIDCTIEQVTAALQDPGEHYTSVIGLMPGITSVELTEQGPGFVTLTTNEGVLMRTGLQVRAEAESVSGVEASGVLGLFYRRLGSSKTGNAFLTSYSTYLESLRP